MSQIRDVVVRLSVSCTSDEAFAQHWPVVEGLTALTKRAYREIWQRGYDAGKNARWGSHDSSRPMEAA